MPHDLPKAYDPTAIEDHWAEYWVHENIFAVATPEDSGAKQAVGDRLGGEPFTILLPPPNVTGRLHMGHMLNQTEMDILIRWHRMRGEKALWVPGTDHAGIATQMMVERQLTSEGSSRQALGREAFEKRVWQWREQYGKAILDQMKRLGASVDWSREYFTMDAGLSVAVREAFTRLYHEGLVYRGAYVVNWCPGCQTAVSDLEVVHEEMLGKLWEIRYPVAGSDGEYLTIATTRPETMLGDVAVAIHPEDERYTHLHGKRLILPLTGREIPIVLDSWVSRDFGTGAVKVTPAHDPNDFALGQRHNLPPINVMDDRARIALLGSPYDGLDRYEARKRIIDDLTAEGLLGAIHDHKLSVGRCDRSKDVIEPRLSTQWFVAVNKRPEGRDASMAELAIAAVQANEYGQQPMRFTPTMYEKTYLNWMTNIRDWCISRQLWWGHRIPAWHCAVCHQITVPKPGDAHDPSTCSHCGSAEITQETDVLDTWFSSGLLPVSVFGWPFLGPDMDGTASADFRNFYPTSLLVTGFDILFFWVARMVMLGCWFSQDVPLANGSKRTLADSVPFREVYIHALVRDANREKMSKTKGNVIDPIEIVKQYGTDAVRFTLASMASPGTDIAFNVARTEGYRAFANKIWNAARFIFMNLDRAKEAGITVYRSTEPHLAKPLNEWPLEDIWIRSRLNRTIAELNSSLDKYRFDDAANALYQFIWGEFCDWYLEIVKLRLDFNDAPRADTTKSALANLRFVFERSLQALSPFMPFLTEEVWQALYEYNPPLTSIALSRYPAIDDSYISEAITFQNAEQSMQLLQRTITSLRTRRKELGVEEKAFVRAKVSVAGITNRPLQVHRHIIEKLAKIEHLEVVSSRGGEYANLAWQADGPIDVFVEYEKPIDVLAERERLTKDIAKLEKNLISAERQLGNESFLAKAPANIVDGLKKQYEENRQLLEKARAALDSLPPES
jgi:valyl-tRNA synthetase